MERARDRGLGFAADATSNEPRCTCPIALPHALLSLAAMRERLAQQLIFPHRGRIIA
jgi:hypothetical protein